MRDGSLWTASTAYKRAAPKCVWRKVGGPLTNSIAFVLFYVGVLIITFIAGYIAWMCLKPQK